MIGAATLLLTISFQVGCSSAVQLKSPWKETDLNIDGDHRDWQDALTFIEKKNISLGMSNDEEFLYICLVTGDRMLQRQMMMMGFYLWIDADGGKEKRFGIHFPIGMVNRGPMMGRRPDGERPPDRAERLRQAQVELEIVGPEEDARQRFGVGQVPGIAIDLGTPDDLFVYEIKIPIQRTEEHPFAILSDGKNHVSIGFEAPRPDRERLRGGPGRGPGPGGGMRGGRGGRHGGRMSGGRPPMPEPFEMWVAVELSEKSSVGVLTEEATWSVK